MIDPTPLLRAWAGMRAAAESRRAAAGAQRRQLLALVARARRTAFGRAHDFASVRSVADFQERVPLRRYEDFWAEFWRGPFPVLDDVTWPGRIPFFAESSGTTAGRTKYIPCSREMVAANARAARRLLSYHSLARPRSRVLGGKLFMLGGSTDLAERAPGVFSGDLSGIAAANVGRLLRRRALPPVELALIADWEEKVARVAESCAGEDVRLIAGTPGWLLVFFDALARRRGGPVDLARWFPALEVLVHGGVDFAPYRRRFEALLAGTGAELREVYAASEGFVAAADRGPDDGLRLQLDAGLFYEFVPVGELDAPEPRRLWIGNAEAGVEYALALSSCAGLWGYVLGDTVEIAGLEPPRLRVTGRTAYTLSAFGEHLAAAEIEAAIACAAEAVGACVSDWSVGAVYPDGSGAPGGHLYFVETDAPVAEAARAVFAARLDSALCERNADYEAHRAGGFGMKTPELRFLPPGSFAAWMKARGRLGGQNKVPRVAADPDLFADLRAFADRRP